MKFSVLLPTRNRLEYLKYAITSVLQQDYQNWEIVISDNDSEQDIKSYISSLADPRILYFRTSAFIPVTDNWNNAMKKSSGDYIIMLGDDDCLAKGYFRTTLKLLQQHNHPDMIYTGALLFLYPGVLSEIPQGHLHRWGNAAFLEGKKEPFLLDKSKSLLAVKAVMSFKNEFYYNIQFSLFSRDFIKKMQRYGDFFQSPYPDFYATTASLLKADRILAVPYPLVAVGITPKSYGFYYLNNKENEGIKFLNNFSDNAVYKNVKKYLLPGTDMNSSWLLAMETVKKNFEKEYELHVDYQQYRLLQILDHHHKFVTKKGIQIKDLWNMSKQLLWREKIIYQIPLSLISLCLRSLPKNRVNHWCTQFMQSFHPQFTTTKIDGNFNNILEAVEHIHLANDAK